MAFPPDLRGALDDPPVSGEERNRKLDKLGDPLALSDKHIDFAAIAAVVDAKLTLGNRGRGGRPPYPTVVMVKLLLLQQQQYNLSDDALEFQSLDRAKFQRFLGLQGTAQIPDAKTIWVWRERLKAQDLIGDISAAVSGQLQRPGFAARGGQIIDVSIVNAPIQRNSREENAAIKHGQVPGDWSAVKRAQKDVEARWTMKHGKSFYG